MEGVCLLLNCFLPHMRTSHVTNLVAKEAVKCSSWQEWLFPIYGCVLWKGERIFVDS